jgi:polyisoprenoid-binding protein YceI
MATTDLTEHLIGSPLAGDWRVVPDRSELGFLTRLFGLIPVRGRYSGYEGELHVDEAGYASGLLRVHTETISTGIKKRDEHLRSQDFFHVSLHPHAHFELTSLIPEERDQMRLIGTLHIRDETLPIDTPVAVKTPAAGMLHLEANFEVDHRAAGFEFKRLPRTVRVNAMLTLERIS